MATMEVKILPAEEKMVIKTTISILMDNLAPCRFCLRRQTTPNVDVNDTHSRRVKFGVPEDN